MSLNKQNTEKINFKKVIRWFGCVATDFCIYRRGGVDEKLAQPWREIDKTTEVEDGLLAKLVLAVR